MKQTTCVCVVILAFVAATGCIATKQTYVSRGNKLYDEGKYSDASLNYRKAIQKDPKFGEAYYRLGLTAIKQNQPREAYDALSRASQLLPNRADIAESLGDVLLSYYLADPSHPQRLYKQISQLADDLLAKNPNSFRALTLKGYLAATDKKPKEAISFFQKALQVKPSDAGVTTGLVQSLIQDGQTQEADRLANNLMVRDKTSYGTIYDLMYSTYYNGNRMSDAENVMKLKANNNPANITYRLELARHYARVRKTAEVKATLQSILDDPKDFPAGPARVGDFYMMLQDYDEAVRNYEAGYRGASNAKDRTEYQKKIMLTRLAQGKTDEAARLADEVLKNDPQNDDALRLQADGWLNSGKRDRIEAALRTFESLAKRYPDDPTLAYLVGRANRLKGDLPAARTHFLEAVKKRRDFLRARYDLVEVDLDQRDLVDATKQANEILAIKPNDERGMLLLAQCSIFKGDPSSLTAARAQLNAMIKNSPHATDPLLDLGLLELKQGRFKDAAEDFQKLKAMGELKGYLGLATTYSSQRQFDEAIGVLQEGLRKWPDSVQILSQQGTTEALAGRYDFAIGHFQDLLKSDPKSAQWRLRIAECYDLKGDINKATEYYQQAHDLVPADPAIAMTLADALARSRHTAEAVRIYQGVLKALPDNITASNNLAFLLADTGGDLNEALKLAKQAWEKYPNDSRFSDTIGYIYLKQGQADSALQTFGNLARKNPGVAVYRYHYGMALAAKGDKTGAKKELQAALAAHPAPGDEQRIKDLLNKI